MRIEYIKIKNFKSINEEITINLSSKKTVIVGQNNAGKTNVIKALDILFGDKHPSYFPLKDEDFFNPDESLEIKAKLVGIDKKNDYPRLQWNEKYKRGDRGRITHNKGELFCKFTAKRINEKIEKEYKIYVNKPFPINHERATQILSRSDDFRKSLLSFVFVPADRTIRADLKTGEYNWYGKLLREIMKIKAQTPAYQRLVTKLKEIENLIMEILKSETILKIGKLLTFIEDLKFSLTRSQNPEDLLRYIEILVKGEPNKYFELSRFGHGTQSAILIGLIELYLYLISKSRNSILNVFAIDEPENFLHPQGKRLINSLLEKISQTENTQVIYTTHSSELITNFEEDLFTLRDIVYLFKKGNTTKIKQFTEEESKEFFKIQEELDVDKGEIFFASGVILVEGETERHSIPLIYKHHSWNEEDLPEKVKEKYKETPSRFFDLDMQNISVINVGGKENIPKYFKFIERILGKRSVVAIIDRDLDFNRYKVRLKQLIKELYGEDGHKFEEYGIFVLPKGEFENYYNEDLIIRFLIREREVEKKEILNCIEKFKNKELKLSKIYKKVFKKYMYGWTKPAIAFKLTKYLLKNNGFDNEIFEILKSAFYYLILFRE